MKDVREQYLPIVNGGPADGVTMAFANAATAAAAAAGDDTGLAGAAVAAGCDEGKWRLLCNRTILAVPNFDGSINSDDGRLNFDKGDAYSAPIRLTTEIEASRGPIRAFARINAWHDAIMMDEDFNRGGNLDDDGERNAGQNIELLDALCDYDGDCRSMPLLVRLVSK